jgi:gas vesicle protein
MDMSNKGGFILGVFIGGLLGAAAGLLFAPSAGEETRTQLMEKGREWKDIATEKALIKSQEAISSTKELIAGLKERFLNSEEVQLVLDQVDEGLSGE